jgi:hypothetical protein
VKLSADEIYLFGRAVRAACGHRVCLNFLEPSVLQRAPF